MKQHSSRGCCTGHAYVDCHSIWITLTVKHSTCHYCKSKTPHKISGAIWGQKRWCWSPFDTQPHFYVVVVLVANAKVPLCWMQYWIISQRLFVKQHTHFRRPNNHTYIYIYLFTYLFIYDKCMTIINMSTIECWRGGDGMEFIHFIAVMCIIVVKWRSC